ncbi:hypothetical protein Fuma_06287 [Fuerstiella marisgermanici]|uniref:Uncharacterized protein n=1 Tax=Fuerstiella marisgermanici TaxID=1891926 RepID=A0A1P8WRD8_9PLAN|nr:hypothetical protein Fuma_06287 [Fuerstiella marisgermanici]
MSTIVPIRIRSRGSLQNADEIQANDRFTKRCFCGETNGNCVFIERSGIHKIILAEQHEEVVQTVTINILDIDFHRTLAERIDEEYVGEQDRRVINSRCIKIW